VLAEPFDPNAKVLVFPKGAPDMYNEFDGDPSKIFIRECYEPLYQKVKDEKKETFILGNPGIGKSLFRMYVAHRLLNDTKGDLCILFQKADTAKVGPRDIIVVKRVGGVVSALVFKPTDAHKSALESFVEQWVKSSIKVVSLVDVSHGVLKCPVGTTRTWYFSSPNEKITGTEGKERRKVAFPPPLWYMLLWSLAELRHANTALGLGKDDCELEERFLHFGGCARAVLEVEDKGEEFLKMALKTVQDVGLQRALFSDDGGLSVCASHSFILVNATADFREGSKQWVSEFVKARVAAVFLEHHFSAAVALIQSQPTNSGYKGELVEQLMLQFLAYSTLVGKGVAMSARPLKESTSPGAMKLEEVKTSLTTAAPMRLYGDLKFDKEHPYSERRFVPKAGMADAVAQAIRDVSKRPDRSCILLQPLEPTMAGVDAFLVIKMLSVIYKCDLQVTSAKDHPVTKLAAEFMGKVERAAVEACTSASTGAAPLTLCSGLTYLVTENRYPTFAAQKVEGTSMAAKTTRGLPQFVVCFGRPPKADDPSASAAADDEQVGIAGRTRKHHDGAGAASGAKKPRL
jgi:hypothetical protein